MSLDCVFLKMSLPSLCQGSTVEIFYVFIYIYNHILVLGDKVYWFSKSLKISCIQDVVIPKTSGFAPHFYIIFPYTSH